MNFEETIKKLEYEEIDEEYILNIGNIPVLLTAVHTMKQTKEDGSIKLSEPFTKAIAMYVSKKVNSSYFIKLKDTNIDSNKTETDYFKEKLIETINKYNIKLVLDIHGANKDRSFDVELGTLNNLSADYSTINELKEAFIETGIKNVEMNNPFKGGGITQTIFFKTNIDVVQVEINQKFRNLEETKKLESICDALIKFIKQYTEK